MIRKQKAKFAYDSINDEKELGGKHKLQGRGTIVDAQKSANREKKDGNGADVKIHTLGSGDVIAEVNGHQIVFAVKEIDERLMHSIDETQKEIEKSNSMINYNIKNLNEQGAKKQLEILEKNHGVLEKRLTDYNTALANSGDEKIKAIKDIINSEVDGYFKQQIAQIESKTKIQLDKAQRDPNEISATEMELFSIVKKYNFLENPEEFKNLVNSTTDKTVKSDGLTLEKNLKKLGAHLTADGKIDDKTITEVEALISKNAPAIKAYKEITGIDPIKKDPSMGR